MLAFAISWAVWVPLALDRLGAFASRLPEDLVMFARLLGTLGPAAAASIIARIADGRGAARALWSQLGRWRARWTWYAAALLVFPALLLFAALVYRLLPGSGPLPTVESTAQNLIVTTIVLAVSAVGEEVGWRGFALPRLSRRTTALGASLLLGVVWTAWHLPWLMNNTGGSLPLALLFHGGYNLLSVGFLPLSGFVPAYGILTALGWAMSIGLLVAYGPKILRRTS